MASRSDQGQQESASAGSCFSDAGYVELLEKLAWPGAPDDWTPGAKAGWRAARRKQLARLERLYGGRPS